MGITRNLSESRYMFHSGRIVLIYATSQHVVDQRIPYKDLPVKQGETYVGPLTRTL